METLIRDLQFALRRLRRSPGFAAVAVLSLALGIGANTAIFSLIDAVILRKPPIPEPARVMDVSTQSPQFSYIPLSYPEYREFRQSLGDVFSQISISQLGLAPRNEGNGVETLAMELVNGEYFPLLGLRPRLGRLLGPDDDRAPGANPVVVLSYDYWRKAFGGDPGVVGRTMRLTGRPYTIVGVAPASYAGTVPGIDPAVYAPIQMVNQLEPSPDDQLEQRGNHSGFMKARLRPGVGLAQARIETESFARQESRVHPDQWGPNRSIKLIPLTDIAVNPVLDSVVVPASALLMGLVGLVLLIACANLASFLLAQARDRQREIAVRLALGARPRVLVRQLLTESITLALAGGIAGVLLARLLLHALLTANLPLPLPITLDVPLDTRVLLFALAASVLAGVLFGLAPALRSTRPDVVETIKSENTGGGPARRVTLRSALVVGQVAVSMLMLIVAGLFVRSLRARESVNPGFGAAPGVVANVLLPSDRYPGEKASLFLRTLETDLRAMPGVQAAGATSNLQLNVLSNNEVTINLPDVAPPAGEQGFSIDYATVDTAFFSAAGIPLVSGRRFTAADLDDSAKVAIVSQTMASRFWPGRDALGQTFTHHDSEYHVIGVARDTKVRSLGEPPRPFLYFPMTLQQAAQPMLVLRTRGNAGPVVTQVLAAIRHLDPDVAVFQATTMRRYLGALVLPARLGALVVAGFAMLALILAVVGVYGVVRYAVARRRREVAIRMSVGAQAGDVVRLLMGHGLALVLVGDAIGLVLGLLGAGALRTFLFGISAFDPVTFLVVPALLAGVGLVAAALPALRATRLDPARVLRAE